MTTEDITNPEPPTFVIDLDAPDNSKPLPSSKPWPKNRQDWLKVSPVYVKYEEEFYDVIKDCAKGIDKVTDVELRLKLNKRLNKIFIIRQRGAAMKLYKELYNINL